MAEKPILKIGHLKITDHLILGVTKDKLLKSEESFMILLKHPQGCTVALKSNRYTVPFE